MKFHRNTQTNSINQQQTISLTFGAFMILFFFLCFSAFGFCSYVVISITTMRKP